MKYYLIAGICLVAFSVQAQKKTIKKTTSSKVVAKSYSLKTLNDSVSYAIGMATAKMYSSQGIKAINSSSLSKGVQDVLAKNKILLEDNQADITILKVTNPAAAKRVEAGAKFLAVNKTKEGVKTTTSGLQYQVIREGSGMKPMASDTVEANYFGTLIDGSEFDSSYKRGEPTSFPLNRVIKGWTEGLQLMSEGAKYRLFIPHRLAYGTVDRGAEIPGGSTLIFEIELLKVKKSKKI